MTCENCGQQIKWNTEFGFNVHARSGSRWCGTYGRMKAKPKRTTR